MVLLRETVKSTDVGKPSSTHIRYSIPYTYGPIVISDVILTDVAVRRTEKVHLQYRAQLVQIASWKQRRKFYLYNGEHEAKFFRFLRNWQFLSEQNQVVILQKQHRQTMCGAIKFVIDGMRSKNRSKRGH